MRGSERDALLRDLLNLANRALKSRESDLQTLALSILEILHTYHTERECVLTCGSLRLEPPGLKVFWKDLPVNGLSLTEFKVVHLLASQAGSGVSYERLYGLVHGEGFVSGLDGKGYRVNTRSIKKRIVQKFQAVDPDWDQIRVKPGFGYSWVSDRAEEQRSLGSPACEMAAAA